MSEYLRWFARRWLWIVVCVFPLGILGTLHYEYSVGAYIVGIPLATGIIIAASLVDYLREKRVNKKFNSEQSLHRARPSLPPRSQLNLDRPIVGVYVRGELAGAHSLITVYQAAGGEWLGGYATLDGRLFAHLADGLKDIPWADFAAELDNAGIWVLPQSTYSDVIAEKLFDRKWRPRRGKTGDPVR
ncbi:hypothetical protein [Leifsonia xyli]|uniref:hypothetical protein n=1 Tax=Leifsonia xyli TaxID=1575 RepID=UPI000B1B3B87